MVIGERHCRSVGPGKALYCRPLREDIQQVWRYESAAQPTVLKSVYVLQVQLQRIATILRLDTADKVMQSGSCCDPLWLRPTHTFMQPLWSFEVEPMGVPRVRLFLLDKKCSGGVVT